ncbi:MAG: hypothetical protein JKY56_05995 [Kofleriaceae bacterium]|nr:hypothetical protein [Kofleriaceae bacterium]
MRLHKLTSVLFLSAALVVGASALGTASAEAQSQSGVKAEIASIKASLSELQKASVSLPTLSQAVAELSSTLAVLEEKVAAQGRAAQSNPGAFEELDALKGQVGRLRTEVEYLRTGIANVEQPAVQSGAGGSAIYAKGMRISTEDGRYEMTLGGYVNARYELQVPEDFSGLDKAGFEMRRSRFNLSGKLGDNDLHYTVQTELAQSGTPLLDYYVDWQFTKEISVRAGQSKLPYTRSFLVDGQNRVFHELALSQDLQRYDRDIGVWAIGAVFDEKLRYHGGVSNGSGLNTNNSNIDLTLSLRLESALMGEYIKAGMGDVAGTETAALTVGAAVVHDLVPVPSILSGIEVGSRDVDADGINDNIRVISTAVDAQYRHKGFDLLVEATWRHERWGAILEHDENRDLSDVVAASSSGHRNYLGFSAEASYFVMPKRLLVGARVSHGRLPVLLLSGRTVLAPPRTQRALQFDGIVQLYHRGSRSLGLSYSLTNFNAKDAPDPDNDISHAMILEVQVEL